MKKIITITSILLFTMSCSTQKPVAVEEATPQPHVLQNTEQDYRGSKIWVGEIKEDNFHKAPYNQWYDTNYNDYTVNQEIINKFKKDLAHFDVTIFMGTWCGDSKALTPEFFKILEAADYPEEKITMYAVDRSKKSLNGEEVGKNIAYVPTFIFYKDGVEVNRIVESPINTLEQDIMAIVSGAAYTPNYSE